MKTEREVVRVCVSVVQHQYSLLVSTPLSKNALREIYQVLMMSIKVQGGINPDVVKVVEPTDIEWEAMQEEFNTENPALSVPLLEVYVPDEDRPDGDIADEVLGGPAELEKP